MKKDELKQDPLGGVIFKVDKDSYKLKKQTNKKVKKNKPEDKLIKAKKNILIKILDLIKAFLIKKNFIKSSTFFKKAHSKKIIEKFNYIFYETNIQKIRESFPEYIYDIYKSLNKLKRLFKDLYMDEKSIDYNNNNSFLFYFIDNLLIKEDKQALDSIDAKYFKAIASDDGKGTEILEAALHKLKERIIENNELAIYHYTSYFEKLLQILDFDFISFFKTFDLGFKQSNYTPKFQPIFGKTGLDKIKELDSFIKIIDFESIPENILIHFNESINALKTSVESKVNKDNPDNKYELKINKQLKTFLNIIESTKRTNIEELHKKIYNLNKTKVIEALIRLITHNFEYTSPAKTPKKKYIVKKYMKLVLEKKRFFYLKTYTEVEFTLIKQKLLRFLKLTSEDDLPTIENYNYKINEKLEASGCHGFKNILPVILYKSFYELFYKDKIDKNIKKILIEGEFINRHEHSIFSTTYYSLNKLNEEFNNLDIDISKGEKNMGQILRFILGEIVDPNFLEVISRKVVEIDSNFEKIIKEGFKAHNKILYYLKLCIEDWKKQNPSLLVNAREIGGSVNKTIFNTTVKAHEQFKGLIEIINSIPQISKLLKDNN